MSSRVAAYVPDLMDRSRVAAVVPHARFVARPADLVGSDADIFVLDLNRPGAVDVVPSLSGRVIGFASHVERDLLEAARSAGCQQVLARSAFFSRLADLLT